MLRKSCEAILWCVLVLACSRGPVSDPVLGKWKFDSGGSVECLPDGTVIDHDESQVLAGEWTRLGDGRIKMEYSYFGTLSAVIWKVSVSGDALTITDEERNQRGTLHRIKQSS
jgi:hypothetical protein